MEKKGRKELICTLINTLSFSTLRVGKITMKRRRGEEWSKQPEESINRLTRTIENYLSGMRSLVTAELGDGNEIAVRCYTLDTLFHGVESGVDGRTSNLSAEIFLRRKNLKEHFSFVVFRIVRT